MRHFFGYIFYPEKDPSEDSERDLCVYTGRRRPEAEGTDIQGGGDEKPLSADADSGYSDAAISVLVPDDKRKEQIGENRKSYPQKSR